MNPMLLAEASGALDSATLTAIQNGFDSLKATGLQIVPLAVAATVGVMVVAKGADFALKKIKSVLSKAS